MNQYHDLLHSICISGKWQQNRTGIRTKSLSGTFLRFDLQDGFPAITTKKLAFNAVRGELVGFLRGATSAQTFRDLGCKVWDANANENAEWLANPYRTGTDDIGNCYGAMWRKWPAYKRIPQSKPAQLTAALASAYERIGVDERNGDILLQKDIDQLKECLNRLMHKPSDRRILFHAWNPAELDAIALPACHILYMFNADIERKELSLCYSMRSVDSFLGLPFNIASAGMLLSLFAHLTGFKPRFLSFSGADTHIYENHMDAVNEQLGRSHLAIPRLKIADRVPTFNGQNADEIYRWLDLIEPADFTLEGYKHHAPLTAPMAV